jgi:hypothetical protein
MEKVKTSKQIRHETRDVEQKQQQNQGLEHLSQEEFEVRSILSQKTLNMGMWVMKRNVVSK